MIEDTIKQSLTEYKGATYSQLQQDLMVLSLNNFKRNGFFVEFGVCDGELFSNTLLLEKQYEWKGIVCEPLKSFHETLGKNRTCIIDHRAVFSESNTKVEFRELHNYKDLSGIVDTFSTDNHIKKRNTDHTSYIVDTVSLTDLLDQHLSPLNIDYISIDTEGSEFNILSTFNFEKYRVNIFSVEHNFIDDKRLKIQNLMESKNYTRILTDISKWDDWYVSNEFLQVRK